MQSLITQISQLPGVTVLLDEPMSKHTTFKIGGPIAALVYPNSFDTLAAIMRSFRKSGIEPLFLGNGSNLLCADGRIERIAVCTRPGYEYTPHIAVQGDVIECSSGALMSMLATAAWQNGLSGLEWAAGIPGTSGGAVVMNAGAYGGDMSQVVERAEVFADSKYSIIERSGLDFAYRHSRFADNPSEIVSRVWFKLKRGDRDTIGAAMKQFAAKRKRSQPLDLPSAGSTFKRPAPKNGEPVYAAELIDKAGLKGFAVGGAAVSDKHAGFIVNTGGATCNDVLRVIEHVQSEVLRQFGVELEREVRIIES